jgi:hypothetical protein
VVGVDEVVGAGVAVDHAGGEQEVVGGGAAVAAVVPLLGAVLDAAHEGGDVGGHDEVQALAAVGVVESVEIARIGAVPARAEGGDHSGQILGQGWHWVSAHRSDPGAVS